MLSESGVRVLRRNARGAMRDSLRACEALATGAMDERAESGIEQDMVAAEVTLERALALVRENLAAIRAARSAPQ